MDSSPCGDVWNTIANLFYKLSWPAHKRLWGFTLQASLHRSWALRWKEGSVQCRFWFSVEWQISAKDALVLDIITVADLLLISIGQNPEVLEWLLYTQLWIGPSPNGLLLSFVFFPLTQGPVLTEQNIKIRECKIMVFMDVWIISSYRD